MDLSARLKGSLRDAFIGRSAASGLVAACPTVCVAHVCHNQVAVCLHYNENSGYGEGSNF
jgi:hypothetical protein